MAFSNQPIFPQGLVNGVQTFVAADTTTVKAIQAAGTNGTKIESFIVTSSDTAARDMAIYITISAVNYLIGTVSIPITAGFIDSTVSVDIMRSAQIPGFAYDPNGNKYLYLAPGSTLSAAINTTVTTAKTITAFVQGGNF
jgi:hypothetical protein